MATTNITLGFTSGAKLFTETDLENTAIAVQASSLTIYEIEIDNTANAAQDNYVKFWNTAGAVTVGTTVPDMVIEVRQGVKRSIVIPDGLAYETGLSVACVTTGGTAGTTSPGSSVVVKIVYA